MLTKYSKKNRLTKVLIGVFFAILVFGIIYQREAYRLYKVVTLFEPDNIVENFQHMGDIFPYHLVNKGEQTRNFSVDITPIIKDFEFNNKTYQVKNLLEDTHTTGFLVIKDGVIVQEQYALGQTPQTLHISWSVNKSFVSALVGIALDEKLINNLMDPITLYVPELKGTGYDDIPIKHILQMSSGVSFDENYAEFFSDINRMGRVIALGNSINEFASSLKKSHESGEHLQYVSMDTQVLGMLLKSVTQKSPAQYLEDKIWQHIDADSNAKWLIDDQGMELAFGTLNLTLRDYARFGWLYANEGNWYGQQLIPKQWVTESTTANADYLKPKDGVSKHDFGYGYQWWLPNGNENDFLARGVYGQYIYVNPDKKVVIVKLSADPNWHSGDQKNVAVVKMFQAITRQLASSPPSKFNSQ